MSASDRKKNRQKKGMGKNKIVSMIRRSKIGVINCMQNYSTRPSHPLEPAASTRWAATSKAGAVIANATHVSGARAKRLHVELAIIG